MNTAHEKRKLYQNLKMSNLYNLLYLIQIKNVSVKSYRSAVRNQVAAYFFSSERPSRWRCSLQFSADYVGYLSTKMLYIQNFLLQYDNFHRSEFYQFRQESSSLQRIVAQNVSNQCYKA